MNISKDRICVIGICAIVAAVIICIIAVHAAGSTSNNGGKDSLESQATNLPRDCSDVFSAGNRTSGVYLIHIRTPQRMYDRDINIPAHVYCDMDIDGGGWTMFQRRINGLVDFYRNWEDYKLGFGYVNGDHWLGLQNLHWMTSTGLYELRVDLEDFDGNTVYAKYASFKIGDERLFFKLYVGDFEGTAADLLEWNRHYGFTTEDQDHSGSTTGNCARDRKGGWWYTSSCGESNLNGLYLGSDGYDKRGMSLYGEFGRNWKTLKRSEMKIRRIG